jgi:uncharacterized protein (DUF2252 family)
MINGYCSILHSGKAVTVETRTATGLVKELLDNVALRKEKKLVKEKADKASGYEKLLIDNKKTFPLEDSLKKELVKSIRAWLDETKGKNQCEILDAAFMLAGTGSIGVKRYLALTSDTSDGKKDLLVIKQALPSSLQQFIPVKQPAWPNDAERISQVQFRMQHVTPGEFGTCCFHDDWYIVKWIQPDADKINFNHFIAGEKEQPSLMDTMGCLTASAQLRSGGRDGSAIADEMIRFGNDQSWINPLLEFTEAYAEQVEKDYEEYCVEYDKGFFNITDPKK